VTDLHANAPKRRQPLCSVDRLPAVQPFGWDPSVRCRAWAAISARTRPSACCCWPARPAKYTNYECGLDPVGGDWAQAQIRYYLYAYLYVLFAVESVFLFPWAVVYARPGFGRTAVVEMGIFVAVLALGLLYAWRKRVLRWT